MDILLCETGNGGDFIFKNNDFVLTDGMHNQFYLAWFGGNVGGEESDKEDTPQSEERTDWWGNDVLFEQNLDFKFNSELETRLRDTALSSSGRLDIEETAKTDLLFMTDFGEVSTDVSITGVDRVEIFAEIQEPNNEENKTFSFIWDATKNEVENQCDDYIPKKDFVQTGDYLIGDYSGEDYLI